MSQSYIRYRLEGQSLAAAKIAADFIYNKAGNIDRSARGAAFIAAHPAEAALLGFDRPTMQAGDCGGRLRAYQTFPALYHAKDKKYYLDCPIAHDGQHFTPKGAAQLSNAQAVSQYFYAGMGENIAPFLFIKPEGIAAPQTAKHLSTDVNYGGRILPITPYNDHSTYVYFPDAKMLAAFKQFQTEEAAFTKAVKDLTDAVSGIIAGLAPKIQQRQEKKEDISPNLYFNDAGKFMSVLLQGGYLPDHPALDIKDSRGNRGDVVFKVRPNTATAEGQALAILFNAVGKRPALAQKLGLPESAHPHLEDIDGKVRLLTNAPVAGLAAEKEKAWILKDAEDKSYGVKPPPRPF